MHNNQTIKQHSIDVTKIINNSINNKGIVAGFLEQSGTKQSISLIHNGIYVPNKYDSDMIISQRIKVEFKGEMFYQKYNNYKSYLYLGILYFQDDLIPDLSIARNIIKRLSFSIYSNLFYSLKDLNNIIGKNYFFDFLDNINETFSFSEIKNDFLIKEKIWDREKVIHCESAFLSITEIKERNDRKSLKINFNHGGQYGQAFLSALQRALIQINFVIEYNMQDVSKTFFKIKTLNIDTNRRTIDQYPPLTFVSFDNSIAISHAGFINENHWLPEWMLQNQDFLINNHESYFNNLLYCIRGKNVEKVNKILDHLRKILPDSIKPNNKKISENDYVQIKL